MSVNDPKVYGPLMDEATKPMIENLEGRLTEHLKQSSDGFMWAVRDHLRRAYEHGLRDGFVQGVQVATDAEGPGHRPGGWRCVGRTSRGEHAERIVVNRCPVCHAKEDDADRIKA